MTKIQKMAILLMIGMSSVPVSAETAGAKANLPQSAKPGGSAISPSLNASKVIYEKFDTEVRIGGRVKADFYEDFNGKQPGIPGALDPSSIPLSKWDMDASRHHHFNTSLAASRISLDVKHQFGDYQTYGYLETDFGAGFPSSGRTNNHYGLRIRHGFGEISDINKVNTWLIGQSVTNYSVVEAYPVTTNNNFGPTLRQAQIRYTRKFAPGFSLALSMERPNTQTAYISRSGAAVAGAVPTSISFADNDTAAYNKSSVPDLTFNARYQKESTLLALRGVVRRLEVKSIAGQTLAGADNTAARDNFTDKKTAWGLGATAMFRVAKPVGVVMSVSGGNGIGRYIDELGLANSFDSYLQIPTNAVGTPATTKFLFQTAKAINFMGGFTINWRDNLETNVGASYTKISLPKNMSLTQPVNVITGAPINNTLLNTKLQRYHANLVYTIMPKTFGLVEIQQYYRSAGSPNTFKGKDTRLTFSFIRNF